MGSNSLPSGGRDDDPGQNVRAMRLPDRTAVVSKTRWTRTDNEKVLHAGL